MSDSNDRARVANVEVLRDERPGEPRIAHVVHLGNDEAQRRERTGGYGDGTPVAYDFSRRPFPKITHKS